MHQLHFLIPDPASFPSGGNIYNACLMHALIRAGIHVSHSAFNSDLLLASPDTRYVLDSIYFDKIDKPETQIPQHCLGLIHHLNSLYPVSEEYFVRNEKHILERFDGFIATSEFTRSYLMDHGIGSDQILVIEPSPLIERHSSRQPSSKVNALIVGTCIPRKGQLAFLEALDSADIPPFYTLSIVGSLTSDKHYARRCSEMILQSDALKKCVRLLGEQDSATIHRLYEHANLVVSVAETETFGMAVQDAVASGLPVLALDRGYAAQHISVGVNGVRCATLKELIGEFRECVFDTDYFIRLQEQAIGYKAPYHTWEEGAEKFIKSMKLN